MTITASWEVGIRLKKLPSFQKPASHPFLMEQEVEGQGAELYAGSLDGTAALAVMSVGSVVNGDFPARYAQPGYLVFVREGVLMAQAFDAKRLKLSGEPVPIAEKAGQVSISDQDTLIYQN